MYSVDNSCAKLSRFYPRNHLMLASALSVLLVITVVFTPSEKSEANRIQMEPPVLASGQQAERASSASELHDQDSGQSRAPTDRSADQATEDILKPNAPAQLAIAQPQPAAHSPLVDSRPEALPAPANTAEPAAASAWQAIEVKSGDNLSDLFTQVGLSAQDLYRVLNSNSEARVLNRLYPGYQLSFNIPEPGRLEQLEVLKSPVEGFRFTRNESGYEVEPILRSAEVRPSFKSGRLEGSLFMAGTRAGIPTATVMEMANVFGGVMDFILDPRAGDEFSILYEEQYLDNEFIGNGEIIAARYTNQGRQHIALRYQDSNGEVGYFSPEGVSMRKTFLRTPLDVFRISSNFNLQRRHPILNTIRAHKGTDYAAPRGTPVRATANGRVTWAARNGSFGKLIVIKHNDQFETKYAHLNGYASGIKKGSRVKQGQIIGYVGTTGGSTGPHLHYEFLVNGVHKNPRKIVDQLPKARTIEGAELARFEEQTRGILEQFQAHDPRLLSFNDNGQQSR